MPRWAPPTRVLSNLVLDGRVYRTAFLPALVALCVAAFALQDRPEPGRSGLPADAFNAQRAFGDAESPEPQSLHGLAAAFGNRADPAWPISSRASSRRPTRRASGRCSACARRSRRLVPGTCAP